MMTTTENTRTRIVDRMVAEVTAAIPPRPITPAVEEADRDALAAAFAYERGEITYLELTHALEVYVEAWGETEQVSVRGVSSAA